MENFLKQKSISHWAEELQTGDKVLANIRHKTDGSKNLMKQESIVIVNFHFDWKVKIFVNGEEKTVDYNELNPF